MSNNSSSKDALDLYAKVEDMLGIKEVLPILYAHYFLFLSNIEFNSILDVGCGSGKFLSQVTRSFDVDRAIGIDLSPMMIEKSREIGVDAYRMDICDIEGSFDILTAIFDMLNYLDLVEIKHILNCIEAKINQGGYLLFDINTLYGFQDVAVGSFIADSGDRFIAIDSEFEEGLYLSEFTLFEKNSDGSYAKSKETISQHYYTIEDMERLMPNMKLIESSEVTLYGDIPDKNFVVFRKV